MRKISLTRLLNEIKLTNKKIDKKISEDINFFDIKTNGKLKNYASEQDMKQKVDSELQSFKSLIKRRDDYRNALLKANSITTIDIDGKSLTIAEAIAKKDVIAQEVKLLDKIANQYTYSNSKVDMALSTIEEKLDDLIRSTVGKDKKTDASEIEVLSKMFRTSNTVALVDASNVKSYLDSRRAEIDDFISNIDYLLSEVNAKTEIEVED